MLGERNQCQEETPAPVSASSAGFKPESISSAESNMTVNVHSHHSSQLYPDSCMGNAAGNPQSGGQSFAASDALLQRQRHSADAQLVDRLQGISLGLVGDNSALNIAVADQLARSLGYIPLATSRIILDLTQQR